MARGLGSGRRLRCRGSKDCARGRSRRSGRVRRRSFHGSRRRGRLFCGSNGFVASTTGLLLAARYRAGRIRTEIPGDSGGAGLQKITRDRNPRVPGPGCGLGGAFLGLRDIDADRQRRLWPDRLPQLVREAEIRDHRACPCDGGARGSAHGRWMSIDTPRASKVPGVSSRP
jgi:hypothetical protein